jgi:uncharacterized protein
MRRSLACAAIAVLLVAANAVAQTLPALTKPVNDFAGVIDAASAAEMDKRIRALDAASHDVVIVATVKTFAPYGTIDEYAVKLYERAGIGKKGQDNGVLILLSMQEKRARIEVGYGLEEYITDGYAGDTIRQTMLPEFRSGRFGAGLLAGTTRLIQRIAEKRGITLADVPKAPEPERGHFPTGLVPVFLIVGFIILMIAMRASRGGPRGPFGPRRGGWPGGWSGWSGGVGGFGGRFGGGSFGGFGGGGGGGGFGGFGGGRSGGGGASGGW